MQRYLIIATLFGAATCSGLCAAAPPTVPVVRPQPQQAREITQVHTASTAKQEPAAQPSQKWKLSAQEKAEIRRQLDQFNRSGRK